MEFTLFCYNVLSVEKNDKFRVCTSSANEAYYRFTSFQFLTSLGLPDDHLFDRAGAVSERERASSQAR